MVYYIWVDESKLDIKAQDAPEAVRLLHAAGIGGGVDDFAGIFSNYGLYLAFDDAGNVTGVDADDCTLRGVKELFCAIAPVVADGSHIDFEGEDGDHWRWAYGNGGMTEWQAHIAYLNDPDELRRLLAEAERIAAEG